MKNLGPDWVIDEKGIPRREGARVVLYDSKNRVLMLRGHDADDPGHQWWFTVGGGIAEGEQPRECAARELAEETGIVIPPEQLVGPVLYRESKFPFANVTARQDELFFIARLEGTDIPIRDISLTDNERRVLDEFRWFTLEELEKVPSSTPVYPPQLPSLIRKWASGWDGTRDFINEW